MSKKSFFQEIPEPPLNKTLSGFVLEMETEYARLIEANINLENNNRLLSEKVDELETKIQYLERKAVEALTFIQKIQES